VRGFWREISPTIKKKQTNLEAFQKAERLSNKIYSLEREKEEILATLSEKILQKELEEIKQRLFQQGNTTEGQDALIQELKTQILLDLDE